MRAKWKRELRDTARSYGLELLHVEAVSNPAHVAVAKAALHELDKTLRANGDTLGSTIEMHTGVIVQARRIRQ